MDNGIETTFDSIESAHEFLGLLTAAVVDAKRDIEVDVQRESGSKFPRRLEALRLALYNVEKLEFHVNKSHRILNDLRSLRRLLFEERSAGTLTVKPESAARTRTEILPPPVISPSQPQMSRYNAGSRRGWRSPSAPPPEGRLIHAAIVGLNTRAGIGRSGRLARNEPRSLHPGVSDRRSLS